MKGGLSRGNLVPLQAQKSEVPKNDRRTTARTAILSEQHTSA
jgi:hypothetical protein